MATIVYLHAHPDDEASQTAGTMARAAAEGHRVVVVFATHGEHGEVAADAVEGETVADYRRREAEASAAAIGLARIVWLGYSDSGMSGWEQNDARGVPPPRRPGRGGATGGRCPRPGAGGLPRRL